MFGMDRLVAAAAIVVAAAVCVWLYGLYQYEAGAAAERAQWAAVVEHKNTIITGLNERLGRDYADREAAWSEATSRANAAPLGRVLTSEEEGMCALPGGVLAELNRIGARR